MVSKHQGDEREQGDKEKQRIIQFYDGAVIALYDGEQSRMRHPEACNDEKGQGKANECRRIAPEERNEGLRAGGNRQIDQVQDEQCDGKSEYPVGKAEKPVLRPSDAIPLFYYALIHILIKPFATPPYCISSWIFAHNKTTHTKWIVLS